jgi:uncharacterized membrane protein YqjE
MPPPVVRRERTRPLGLFGSLKRLLATLVELVRTRLELLSNELQAEKERLIEIAAVGALAVFCLSFGAILLTFLLVVLFWDNYRLPVLVILTGLYFLFGLIAALSCRRKLKAQSAILAATLAELAKDREQLYSEHETPTPRA